MILSNPNATRAAADLYSKLTGLAGQHILTGQHNYPNTASSYSDEACELTGKYPALWGQDFGFSGGTDKDSVLARQAIIDEAKRQYDLGSVITLMWHAVRPTDDEPVTFADSIQGKVSDDEWREIVTPGTDSRPLGGAGRCCRRLPRAATRCRRSRTLASLSRDERRLVLVGRETRGVQIREAMASAPRTSDQKMGP